MRCTFTKVAALDAYQSFSSDKKEADNALKADEIAKYMSNEQIDEKIDLDNPKYHSGNLHDRIYRCLSTSGIPLTSEQSVGDSLSHKTSSGIQRKK